MKNLICIIWMALILIPQSSFSNPVPADSSMVAPSVNLQASLAYQKTHNTGRLSDFPRLHPLIVHFPIVLIILAFIFQIFSFFISKKELSRISLFLIVFGFAGAYIATNILHGGDPDPAALGDIARKTFERHEHFAHLTEWFSGIASLVKLSVLFFDRKKLGINLLATLLMGCAVYTITVTGEMGARLVHIDAIGVQGNQIPLHDED